jgi:signal transduction histidine kinase
MRIRAYLFLMAVGILVPVVLFSGLSLRMLKNAERDAALRSLSETAKGISLLVDRELYRSEASLTVLAGSSDLARTDLSAFYQQARTVDRDNTGWTVLLDRKGRELINTQHPLGAVLPTPRAIERVHRVMATGKTYVSDVGEGPDPGHFLTTVTVPVAVDAGQRFVLSQAFSTDHFNKLIASASVPAGWLVAIIDTNGRYIARNLNADSRIGQLARPELVAAAAAAPFGQIRHRTLEGVDSFDVFHHTTLSGWTVAVAAPVEMIERSTRNASMVAALGLFAAMLCALVLAVYFGRQHVRSIRGAVDAARGLGKGIPPAPMHSPVVEVAELHTALHAAGEQLVQAQEYRRQAEAERQSLLESERAARVMAEQQNNAKDQFLAMLGHELRNPLAPISTAAQLLRLKAGDASRVRYASDVITRQVDHMNSLLGDMLDVSRVTRGLVKLAIGPVDLKAVLERAVEQTHALVDMKHHQLDVVLPGTSVVVQGDQTRLIQIFANLLNNAAKYTPPYGRICLEAQTGDGVVQVSVRDNGEGIAPTLLPRVFDLFSQGERTPDRSQGGLGLGLALVRSLVYLHGGKVAVDSAGPGKGSTFSVVLPWVPGTAAPDTAPAEHQPALAQGLNVMLVDDNIDGAVTLSLLLREGGGHKVTTYYDARAALEWAATDAPDVFILDIGLPDMTGYELARRLRQYPECANAIFIALTGYGQSQDRDRARAAGFDFHVAKPADPPQILELLGKITVVPG